MSQSPGGSTTGRSATPARTRGSTGAPAGPPRRPADAVGASDRRHSRPSSAAVYRRRRLVVLVGMVLVVGLVAALVAWVWPGFARSDAAADPAPTVTVTADAPTPTLEPAARTGTTAFALALPDTVLDLVLRSDSATDAWTAARALEAYELVYADGEGADATTVTVVAGQWPTTAEAEAAAADLVAAAGEPTDSGDVEVGGEVAGTYAVSPAADGQATVTWRNGTAVLQASGPADAVADVYEAYPL
ncbi:hypothetical protein [Cellulosimicrobium protaetiae]|uniref:Uncharacterized protein n=1 Tax=Cellulosimicrobium protaetiae TaxID=2587808 RepID=A0A6M5UKD6_9MICO|nr:hypothetical protein [Cellulosimicrobium protaetiae]QJW37691.1 hypothetical protein FIC82_017405 [Cellulosimicrobium protaetiae]